MQNHLRQIFTLVTISPNQTLCWENSSPSYPIPIRRIHQPTKDPSLRRTYLRTSIPVVKEDRKTGNHTRRAISRETMRLEIHAFRIIVPKGMPCHVVDI